MLFLLRFECYQRIGYCSNIQLHPGSVFLISDIVGQVGIATEITDPGIVCPAGGLMAQWGISLRFYDSDEEDLHRRHQDQRLGPKGFIHTVHDCIVEIRR